MKKHILAALVLLCTVLSTMAQDHGEVVSLSVSFRQSSSVVDPNYRDNNRQFTAFLSKLDSLTADGAYIVRRVTIRGTASPEGTYAFNQKLSWSRATRLKNYLVGFPAMQNAEYSLEGQGVAWGQLEEFLESHEGLPYRDTLLYIIRNIPETETLPGGAVRHNRILAMKSLDKGRVYRDIFQKFFKQMRGAYSTVSCELVPAPLNISITDVLQTPSSGIVQCPEPQDTAFRRLPLLALKTNLLFDLAPFYPGYGWAPAPNVEIEYYPARGNWTVGASLDCPWWKNREQHKYFQVRNYQLEARRYFSGSRPAYTGWFVSGYVHGGLFGIGLNSKVGGQGEGVGAGLGAGYVFPLSRDARWRMELSFQAGYSYAWYDRYVYGNPVTGNDNGLYYYNWTGHADDFVPRLYRKSWLGPTRAGVVISYDLFRRKKKEVVR